MMVIATLPEDRAQVPVPNEQKHPTGNWREFESVGFRSFGRVVVAVTQHRASSKHAEAAPQMGAPELDSDPFVKPDP